MYYGTDAVRILELQKENKITPTHGWVVQTTMEQR